MTSAFPDLNLSLYSYVRKEAVLSSQVEGTQSSLSDLLLYENAEIPGVPLDDVQEVSNYVAALNHGLKRLRGGFPLSLRLIREIHEVLLSKGRGSHAQSGEFRKSQNWIGGTRPGNAAYVPPPPNMSWTAWGIWSHSCTTSTTHSPADPSRARSCSVRDDPPVFGWQRTRRQAANHVHAHRKADVASACALPQLVL
jgi:hypothetical protein